MRTGFHYRNSDGDRTCRECAANLAGLQLDAWQADLVDYPQHALFASMDYAPDAGAQLLIEYWIKQDPARFDAARTDGEITPDECAYIMCAPRA
jgi:hypothetical protein